MSKSVNTCLFHLNTIDSLQYPLQELPIIQDFTTFVSEEFAKNHTKWVIKKCVIQKNYVYIIEDRDLLT